MFIAADINNRALKRKKGQLEFKLIINSNQRQANASLISARETERAKQQADCDAWNAANPGTTKKVQDIKLDTYYKSLQALDTKYETEKESIDSQLSLINANITSLDKLVQNNISQDNTLWCVGGS